MFCHFLCPKSNQKGSAVEKSNHFDATEAAQKKLALASVQACSPWDWLGSNSFLLHPPPWRQNGDFSKAIGHAAWHFVQILCNLSAYANQKMCTLLILMIKKAVVFQDNSGEKGANLEIYATKYSTKRTSNKQPKKYFHIQRGCLGNKNSARPQKKFTFLE